MRTKVTLVLIFLNVALFFFIFKFERNWRTEAALQETRRRVLGAETADIRTLTVASSVAGAPSYSLVRNRDVWMLTQPLDWPANQDAVTRIIHALQFLDDETSFSVSDLAKNGQSLADYGLDKPKITVTFTSADGAAAALPGQIIAGPQTVLRIGDATKIGNRLYVLSPDGTRVHVVSRSLADTLSLPMDELRANSVLTVPVFEARALSVQSGGTRVRIRRDTGRWLFDTIINARASKTAMDLVINQLTELRAKSFPTVAPATLPSNSPSLRVTVDGNNRSETLFLGDAVKPTGGVETDAKGAAGDVTEYYAQLMNGNSLRAPVFTVLVPNRLLQQLKHAQDELRDRRLVEFDPAAVTAITLSAPNQLPITLQRLDANAPDSSWQVMRRAEKSAGPQTMAADSTAVHRVLDKLSLLSATKFESDAPSPAQLETWGFNRPEREITLALAASPGAPSHTLVIQLGLDNAGAVFARSASAGGDIGPSVYAVSLDLAQDFPVDIVAWRDRTLQDLPATAKIAALKLVDVSSHQVLFETAFDSAGHSESKPRDSAALDKLVANIRSLHAKRFVQEGFPEKLLVAGDERSWRYELDITVALPAATGGEPSKTTTVFFTERVGGALQLAGSKDFDAVFEIDQPLIDALWTLTYGPRDPGAQVDKK